MEPYSADKIKRKKWKYQEPNPTDKIITLRVGHWNIGLKTK